MVLRSVPSKKNNSEENKRYSESSMSRMENSGSENWKSRKESE